MITTRQFEGILRLPESSTLDFKKTNYVLNQDYDQSGTAKFVKDIISFTNTIRTEPGFIILGVGIDANGNKEMIGINESIDDAIFQDKIKDKTFPRPVFNVYTFKYINLTYGIIEIPVFKYNHPVIPVIKLKGLEVGRVYYRRGSANTEALAIETLNISDWLRSLPESIKFNSIHEEIATFIKRLTEGQEKLSGIMIDLIVFAKRNNLNELREFCHSEISGINSKISDQNQEEFRYRVMKVKLSFNSIEINPYSFVPATEQMIKGEIAKSKDFYDYNMLNTKPLHEMEEHIAQIKDSTLCSTIKSTVKKLFPTKTSNEVMYVYIFNDDFKTLYRSIRQKTIDKLMNIG